MRRMYQLKFGLLLMAVATAVMESSSLKILDDEPIEFVANKMCEIDGAFSGQIAQLETIGKLITYLEKIPPHHDLYHCRFLYLDTLQQLNEVITNHNDNVCSRDKIDLIEKFHNNFISKWPADVKLRKELNLQSPKVLDLFFIHYAYQVSVVCKLSLLEQLNSKESKEFELKTGKSERFDNLDKIIKKFYSNYAFGSPKNIGSITIGWKFLDRMKPELNDGDYYDTPTAENGFKRATYAVSDSVRSKRTQTECRQQLRPIYGNLLLPVIRLIDMGYYLDDEPFAKELSKRATLRRLIGLTLICEHLMPIRIVQDESMKAGRMLRLDKSEAKLRFAPEIEDKIEDFNIHGPKTERKISLEQMKMLPNVTPEEGSWFAKNLKNNIAKHDNPLWQATMSISARFKSIKKKILTCFSSNQQQDETFYPNEALPLFNLIA